MRKIFFGLTFVLMLLTVPSHQAANAWSLFPQKVCEAGNADCAKSPSTACKPGDTKCANICAGEGAKSALCTQAKGQNKTDNPVARLLGSVANLIAVLAGVIAVIMIVIAGFQLVTSGGNSEQVTKARGRILGAIVGLIIIALAWTIIRLVTDNVLK